MFAKIALRVLPWVLVVALALAFWLFKIPDLGERIEPQQVTIRTTSVLEKVESLGRLELVRYNFREITELKQKGKRLDIGVGWIPLGGDAEIVLFTSGEAVGCIDLTTMVADDLQTEGDTLWVRLPTPELCYFKIDLQNSRVYNFEADSYVEEERFLDSAYKIAEAEIRNAALKSDILSRTEENARLILKPFLEQASGKKVLFRQSLGDPLKIEIHD